MPSPPGSRITSISPTTWPATPANSATCPAPASCSAWPSSWAAQPKPNSWPSRTPTLPRSGPSPSAPEPHKPPARHSIRRLNRPLCRCNGHSQFGYWPEMETPAGKSHTRQECPRAGNAQPAPGIFVLQSLRHHRSVSRLSVMGGTIALSLIGHQVPQPGPRASGRAVQSRKP